MHKTTTVTTILVPAKALTWAAGGLLLSAGFLLWLGTLTDIDLRLADYFFDAATQRFPWRDAWLTETLGHRYAKIALTVLAVAAIGISLGEVISRRSYLTPWWRLRLRVVAASAVFTPLTISLLKRTSDSHCPWDLARYGGDQPYLRILDHVPAWIEAGKCLPGGHASTALWLVAICVVWLPRHPRMAALAGTGALLLGAALGWIQQMRGAHFLTHTLWSLWISVAVVVGVLCLQAYVARNQGRRFLRPPPNDPLAT